MENILCFICHNNKKSSGGLAPALLFFHLFERLGCKGSGWVLPGVVTTLVNVSVLSHVWFLAVTCSHSTDF